MGFKNNTIEYGFGQMGSILITGNTNAVTCRYVATTPFKAHNAVFCAIQSLEDTDFDNAGLTSEDNTIYITDTVASTRNEANRGA